MKPFPGVAGSLQLTRGEEEGESMTNTESVPIQSVCGNTLKPEATKLLTLMKNT